MGSIVNVRVEKSFGGYMFSIEGKSDEYFFEIKHGKPIRAFRILNNDKEKKEEILDLNIIYSVFAEILILKKQAIGGSMCQMIESWGGEEKVQNARKGIMWKELQTI